MIRAKVAITLLASVAVLTVAACGSSSKTKSSPASSGSSASGKVKVAIVIPGPVFDKGFDQTGYDGLQLCKSEGAQTSYVQNVATPDYVRTFETLARANNVVIGHGNEFDTIAEQVAPKFPNVKFIVDSDPAKPSAPNVENMITNSTPGAFLAGIVAGKATKTNKLGAVGGQQFPVLQAQFNAFLDGARLVNPKATMKLVYIGTFTDPSKGREAAQSLAASGADVIFHIADNAGIGVINGAAAAGVKAIGWGLDQHSVAPGTVIASQIVNQAAEIGAVCKQILAGHFAGGTLRVDGLRDGMIGLSPVYNLPASVQAKVGQVKQNIIAGKVTVPSIGGGVPGDGPGSG